ncbi:MAG: ThiF family adenylyltransferase [Spirochaetaceae bacterium]|nr:ThiF family adenylyltransferase [Spirochaetaceae bacterium]
MSFDERTRIILGEEGAAALAAASVAVYGLGGVGAACAMDLVRVGVGRIVAVDFDDVAESNLNRLYFGYRAEIGRPKAEVFAEYARRVNPGVVVEAAPRFFSGEGAAELVAANAGGGCAVHLDCVDALNPKVNLLAALSRAGLAFAASMGTAGRLDPGRLRLSALSASSGCPLAREVRNRLRRLGVGIDFPAVWSDEPATPPVERPAGPEEEQKAPGRIRKMQGSAPFVPQAAGHLLASWATRRLLGLA